MQLDQSIFKAYDVRGVYPTQLNEEIAEKMGKAFSVFIEQQVGKEQGVRVAVGRDTRLSSPQLFEAAISGILSQGVDVDDVGLVSADVMYFTVGNGEYDGGMMISASHNPKEYNGFKMLSKGVKFISSVFGLPDIKALMIKDEWQECVRATRDQKEVVDDYIDFVFSRIDVAKINPFKIVVDTGNGMAGVVARKLFEKLPCEFIPLFEQLDGNFPGRNPNPLTPGALDPLSAKVKEVGADLGIAFDADADRLFVVDDTGAVIRNDLVLGIVAQVVLRSHPNEAIVYSLNCSHTAPEMIAEAGGRPVRARVGHTFIKETMKAENAVFGGEASGHFYFRENFYSESGFLTALVLMQYMSEQGKPLSLLASGIDRYAYQPETNRRVDDRAAVIARIKEQYRDGRQDETDGLVVEYDDWWFLLRQSNTEPLVRLVVEAKTKEIMQEKVNELLDIIGGEPE